MTEKGKLEVEALAGELLEEALETLDVEDLLLHSISHMEGSPGIVWDEDTARDTPCYCADNICFSRGIIGTLSEPQREWACNPRRELDSPALRQRIEKFKGAAASCQAEIAEHPKGERLRPWLECMGRELRGPRKQSRVPLQKVAATPPHLIGPRERREVPEELVYFADSREQIMASTEPYRQQMDRAFREAIERARLATGLR